MDKKKRILLSGDVILGLENTLRRLHIINDYDYATGAFIRGMREYWSNKGKYV